VIIAGMGGETIIRILEEDLTKSQSFKRLILQPRTFTGKLRVWLSENGFKFVDYALCREKKLICEVMAVEKGDNGQSENELVSSFLLKKGDPLLEEYLKAKLKSILNILKELKKSNKDNREMELHLEKDALYIKSLLENQ
jgi:tRNA (adenine22-N1)-methyltransferase